MNGAERPSPVLTGPLDRFAELHAPVHWEAVDFIADLHLQSAEPETAKAWLQWLDQAPASHADALVILGDLFEVWVGDDVLDADGQTSPEAPFLRQCADALARLSARIPVYFMAGNRDFLLGDVAAARCGMTVLPDPTLLTWHGQRWLLSHGDALCLADHDYQRFRLQVRDAEWRHRFLQQPLADRESVARQMRERSETIKRHHAHDASLWADVDHAAAAQWLEQTNAQGLIHGHTHRPGQHDLPDNRIRWVLSDWDCGADPPRAQILRLDAHGLQRVPLKPG